MRSLIQRVSKYGILHLDIAQIEVDTSFILRGHLGNMHRQNRQEYQDTQG